MNQTPETTRKPLNILLYSNSFLPQVGGREMVVFHLAKALAEAGHNARVVSPGGWWSQRNAVYPFAVQRWPRLPGLSRETAEQIQLTANIARYGCDVIHAHATYPAGYAARQYKRFSHIPLVITPHGEDIHIIPEIGHGMRLNPVYARKIEQVLNTAEYLTAISDSVVKSLIDAGAPESRIVQIANGVDFTRFDGSAKVAIRDRYSIAAGKRIVLTVGNYVRRRGHEELVRSFPAVVAKHPDAHLVIVGRGTEVLQPVISELGIAESVTLTGAVAPRELDYRSDDLVGAFYAESDVYVAPGMSEGSEGLSLALLDAMASGAAIVATNISGNRDVIRHAENGMLVAPGEPAALAEGINSLLRDRAASLQYRQQALSDVKPLSWNRIAQQYVEVYRQAIASVRQNSNNPAR